MAMKKHTRLDLVEGGNIFKQGDYVTLGFIPRDYTGASVDLTNKQIEGSIFNESTGVIYEGPASFVDGKIFFTIKQVLNDGKFQLEFTVTDAADPEYRTKFPTDDYASELTIKPSADNLDYVGVSMTTVAQLRTEQEQKQQQFELAIVPQVDELKQRVEEGIGAFTEDTEVKDARMDEINLRTFNQKVVAQLAETGIRYSVARFNSEKGNSTENVLVTNNFVLEGIERGISNIYALKSLSKVFIVNATVYRLRNFTLRGVSKNTTGISAPTGNSNFRGLIENIHFSDHNICIDFEKAYINEIDKCHFQNSKVGIKIEKDSYSNIFRRNTFLGTMNALDMSGTNGVTATNTFRFEDNTVEVYNVGVKNKTEIYLVRCYFGDNNGSFYAETLESDKVMTVTAGSTTYARDCWLGIVAPDYATQGAVINDKNFISSVVNFDTANSNVPTTVEIVGGDIYISNHNVSSGKRQAFVYVSRSPLDRISIDKVKLRISKDNPAHNAAPYLLEDGYSPLYSHTPLNNYVINGAFTDSELTNYYLNQNPLNKGVSTSIVPSVTNQYGGQVIRWDNAGVWGDGIGMAFRYRVPKHLVGKPMVLEIYVPNVIVGGSEVSVKYNSGTVNSDLVHVSGETYSNLRPLNANSRNGSRTPYRNIMLVKPTKENGIIRIDKTFNDPSGVFCEISSITLSEIDNYQYLGQYVDYAHPSPVKCSTSNRPTLPILNEQIFDTSLGKPLWWNGTKWVDSSGV